MANGLQIPKLGLGTWFIDDDRAVDAVRTAIEIGYRNIDTAQAYGNERGVGEGVRSSGLPRDELFVSTKTVQYHLTRIYAKLGIRSRGELAASRGTRGSAGQS